MNTIGTLSLESIRFAVAVIYDPKYWGRSYNITSPKPSP